MFQSVKLNLIFKDKTKSHNSRIDVKNRKEIEMKKTISISFLWIICLSLSAETFHKRLAPALYVNEICIKAKQKDEPIWIELINLTKEPINLKGYVLSNYDEKGIIKKDFIIKPQSLGVLLIYIKQNRNMDFENRISTKCPIYTVQFQKSIFRKKESESFMNLALKTRKGDLVSVFSGKELKDNQKTYFTNFLGGNFWFSDVSPGMTFQLYDGDDYGLSMCYLHNTPATPGGFYIQKKGKPELGVYFNGTTYGSPSLCSIDEISRKKDIVSGKIVLLLKNNITVLDKDWKEFTFDLSYDKNFKQPIFDKSKEFRICDQAFTIDLTYEDYLYLLGKKLYARIGRKNKDGKTVWSETKSFAIPNLEISFCALGGLSLSDISKTSNEINFQDDISKVKKIASLIKKLKKVIDTLGIADMMNPNGEERLEYIKVNDNLSGMWLSFYLYGIKCLPCAKSREVDAKQLKKITDFSFLKGINHLGLDFGGTALSEVGGLRLILEKLPEKPTGLRLVACNLPNISPLAELSLEELDISRNKSVRDLKPLSGMPLKKLNIKSIGPVDLSPLVNCKYLKEIVLSPEKCGNLEKLKEIPTLTSINSQSVKMFFSKQ